MSIDKIIGNVLKANLLLSDYTLTDNLTDKETLLNLIRDYVDGINDSKISLVFDKICLCQNNENEKDLYIQILTDLLTNLENSLVKR